MLQQKCIPVGCQPTAAVAAGWRSPDTEPWTENTLGQRPPWTETIPGQRPPGQKPPGQRPPAGQRLPPWTNTSENITVPCGRQQIQYYNL